MNKSEYREKASMISCLNDAKQYLKIAKNHYHSIQVGVHEASITLAEGYLEDAEAHYNRWVEIVNGAS